MELFHVGLQQVETHMRNQFDYTDQPQPERPDARRPRVTVTERARLAVGRALYALANAIDPNTNTPIPSRQH
jgi:hypothetical protein